MRPWDLTRKRAIRHNVGIQKKKPACSTDPKLVTPSQRVKTFPDKTRTVSAEKLFCSACRVELSLKQSIIKNYKELCKHVRSKDALGKREIRERDIAQAMKEYYKNARPAGETPPEAQRVFRAKVVTAFFNAGTLLNKLDHFQEVLEEHAYKLVNCRGMYDLIPFVLADEQKHNKAEKHFDGTTRLGKALVVVNQFVAKWRIGQPLIRLQLLTKSNWGGDS